jgi:phosphoglycerate dehydrogenase-like enzyme
MTVRRPLRARRAAPGGRPPVVLVYNPDEAAAYAKTIRPPHGRAVTIHIAATEAEAAAVAGEIDIVYGWKFPSSLYARTPRLAWHQVMGAGVDWVFVPELPRSVVVTRAPGVFGAWMSEYVLGWCLWVTQRMETYRAAQREQRWRGDLLPARLRGATLALVGLGDIGRTIARAAAAVGMNVIGVSRSGRAVPAVKRVYRVAHLHRALATADFVVLVVPLTSETRGLIDDTALAAMRPSAWLLNIGRGALVDEVALLQALRARRIAGAVLDVFPREPLPDEHPLWRLDNAVITPHISGPSTPDELAPIFNENLARWLAGRPLRHVVDRRRGY